MILFPHYTTFFNIQKDDYVKINKNKEEKRKELRRSLAASNTAILFKNEFLFYVKKMVPNWYHFLINF